MSIKNYNCFNMANEFKKCPNGHYYQGDHCPYCKSGVNATTQTDGYGNHDNYDNQQTTEAFNNATSTKGGENATIVGDGIRSGSGVSQNNDSGKIPMTGRTVFGDEEEVGNGMASGGSGKGQGAYRETRKLAGWLVSYTLDPLGIDFKIFEGRNIIGRDTECNITINDNRVSSKHAVLLFRAGKYSITDSQSSHGTFVNDKDIELEPYYLQDGDVIRIGQTELKFRSSF